MDEEPTGCVGCLGLLIVIPIVVSIVQGIVAALSNPAVGTAIILTVVTVVILCNLTKLAASWQWFIYDSSPLPIKYGVNPATQEELFRLTGNKAVAYRLVRSLLQQHPDEPEQVMWHKAIAIVKQQETPQY